MRKYLIYKYLQMSACQGGRIGRRVQIWKWFMKKTKNFQKKPSVGLCNSQQIKIVLRISGSNRPIPGGSQEMRLRRGQEGSSHPRKQQNLLLLFIQWISILPFSPGIRTPKVGYKSRGQSPAHKTITNKNHHQL